MKFGKIVFALGLISVLIVSLICFLGEKPLSGEVESVNFFENSARIKLIGQEEELVVFSKMLDLKKGDKILFWGKADVYRGENQIIVERLEKVVG